MHSNSTAARFIARTTWRDLPESVKSKARMCLIDSLGATLAGTLTKVSEIGSDYATTTWPSDTPSSGSYNRQIGEATILLKGKRASAVGAAFANCCAANGLDVDDSARYAYGHAGAQIFPTALAVAEARGLSGAQMLCGIVVGYEIAHRIGRCWHASRRVYQACGSWGAVACAAVASHLMDLTPDRVEHALGIAEYHSPNLPMMRDVDNPAMVKHGIAWGAMTGIIAADLAARGFTGIPGMLSEPAYQDWVEDIGREYLMVDGVSWKPARYACCGWAHAGVEGARQLVLDHHIHLEDIACIRVEGSSGTARLGTRLPSTTEEAQFNQAWPLAAMLLDGKIGPDQILESRLSDPQIRALARKVEVVQSEEIETLHRLFEKGDPEGRFASRVTIKLQDGRSFHTGLVEGGLKFPPGDWDKERMVEKFYWLVRPVLKPEVLDAVLSLLWNFDELLDTHSLTNLLVEIPESRRL
jgi:2-methylcitrate dehydratase PrpD